jgi:hypothetical protein
MPLHRVSGHPQQALSHPFVIRLYSFLKYLKLRGVSQDVVLRNALHRILDGAS